ncbi:MAG TPA: ThiF family adenylyltransferase [bacterium]|nr:ThiF family adenylyltransferase [bacterium]
MATVTGAGGEGVATAVTPAPSPPEAPKLLSLPIEITFLRYRPLQVVLVGAGGTGARIAADIARLLGRGDKLVIIDPDLVEDRNLARQHFVRGDIGRYKAEVVAKRAQMAAAPGVEVEARVMTLDNLQTIPRLQQGGNSLQNLWIGAVDNRTCRRMAALGLLEQPDGIGQGLWIDVGNELRGGQVALMGAAPIEALNDANTGTVFPTTREKANIEAQIRAGMRPDLAYYSYGAWMVCNAVAELTPAILRPNAAEEGATPDCEIRVDTQTLAANVMAACTVMNVFSRIIDGLPVSMAGAFFSTANTMLAKPFKHATREGNFFILGAEAPYASRGALGQMVRRVAG